MIFIELQSAEVKMYLNQYLQKILPNHSKKSNNSNQKTNLKRGVMI
jgi:hypothetical protein